MMLRIGHPIDFLLIPLYVSNMGFLQLLAVGLGILGMGMQASAAGRAREAGNIAGGRIEQETKETIRRKELSQGQQIGETKARLAASGVQVDFSKPLYTEQEVDRVIPGERIGREGALFGVFSSALSNMRSPDRTVTETERTYREARGGGELYLQTMMKEFKRDLDWIKESGATRAKEARAGGAAAESQALAGMVSTGAQVASQAYDWWG